MIVMIHDLLERRNIPVQLAFDDFDTPDLIVKFTFEGLGLYKVSPYEAACAFLKIAQDKAFAPVVAVEVRNVEKGAETHYLADKRKRLEPDWKEIKNTTFRYNLPLNFGETESMVKD